MLHVWEWRELAALSWSWVEWNRGEVHLMFLAAVFLLSNLFLIMHYQNMFSQYPVIWAQPRVMFLSSVRTKGKWEPWNSGSMKSKLLVGLCLPRGGGSCLHLLCSQSFLSCCCLDKSWLWIASNMTNFCLRITTSPSEPVREKQLDQCQLTVRRATARPGWHFWICSGKEAAFSLALAMCLSCSVYIPLWVLGCTLLLQCSFSTVLLCHVPLSVVKAVKSSYALIITPWFNVARDCMMLDLLFDPWLQSRCC